MRPRYHVVSSLAFGIGFWKASGDLKASLACLLAGILIDIDHVIDFYIHNRIKMESPLRAYRRLRDWCFGLKFDALYICLHSIELLLLIWLYVLILKPGIFWLAIAVGLTQHMILDIIFNSRRFIPPRGYLFFYRMKKGFKKDALMRRP
ncbi:MAG: hypothetical protein PHR44_03420 [Candidatus Omnitrophica bacterium]|nr:hypothetical protein [Candidatus Omnitrophota bacterium]